MIKELRTKNEKVVISPAKYQDIATDRFKDVAVKQDDGSYIVEKHPIYQRILIEPIIELRTIEFEVYIVDDGVDKHEFIDEKTAKDFARNIRK